MRGRDVREVPLSDLMDHISMVFQRVYLFQDSIYNNIAMGRPDATRRGDGGRQKGPGAMTLSWICRRALTR